MALLLPFFFSFDTKSWLFFRNVKNLNFGEYDEISVPSYVINNEIFFRKLLFSFRSTPFSNNHKKNLYVIKMNKKLGIFNNALAFSKKKFCYIDTKKTNLQWIA